MSSSTDPTTTIKKSSVSLSKRLEHTAAGRLDAIHARRRDGAEMRNHRSTTGTNGRRSQHWQQALAPTLRRPTSLTESHSRQRLLFFREYPSNMGRRDQSWREGLLPTTSAKRVTLGRSEGHSASLSFEIRREPTKGQERRALGFININVYSNRSTIKSKYSLVSVTSILSNE